MKLGVFGGTFDPVHTGHLLLAEAARQAARLDRVIFLPTGIPPHKRMPKADAAQRMRMLRLATQSNPFFSVSDWEIRQKRTVYTYETLAHFSKPGEIPYFILGSDSLRDLPQWRHGTDLLREGHFVVIERPEAPWTSLSTTLRRRAVRVPAPLIGISSHDIQRQFADGKSTRYGSSRCGRALYPANRALRRKEGGMKRRAWVDVLLAAPLLVLTAVVMLLDYHSSVARSLHRGDRVIGILLGSDYEDYARHSDTVMLVSYDPQSRFLDVLSIPRDTKVDIPGVHNIQRINEVFTYEYRHSQRNFDSASKAVKHVVEVLLSSGGPSGLSDEEPAPAEAAPAMLSMSSMTTVASSTPMAVSAIQTSALPPSPALKIPYYFTIDYGGFKNLIDAMDGIYITVTEPMHYDDNWGNLHIHFSPGTYHMDGATALKYVRFRGGNGDQGRVLRQQLFVKEISKRFKNPSLLWKFPKYAHAVMAGIHTNFSTWDLVTIMVEGRGVRWSNIRLFSLPGRPLKNLWKMNSEETQRLVAMLQAPAPRHGIPIQLRTHPVKGAAPINGATVEVWNASDKPNAARYVMGLLRQNGFDVVVYGKFSSRQTRTLVIDRSGKLRPAQAAAQVLSAANPEVISRIETSRQVDVSVIIGNDFPMPESKPIKTR